MIDAGLNGERSFATKGEKLKIVQQFLSGHSIGDVSSYNSRSRPAVESIIREGFTQTLELLSKRTAAVIVESKN